MEYLAKKNIEREKKRELLRQELNDLGTPKPFNNLKVTEEKLQELSNLSSSLKELKKYVNNFKRTILEYEKENAERVKENIKIKKNLETFKKNISHTLSEIDREFTPILDEHNQFYNTLWNTISYNKAKKRDWVVFVASLIVSFLLGFFVNSLSQKDFLKKVEIMFSENSISIIDTVRSHSSEHLKNDKTLITELESLQYKIEKLTELIKKYEEK